MSVALIPESGHCRHPGDPGDGVNIDFMSGAVMHEVPCLAVVIAEHRNQIQHFVVNASGLRHAPAIKGMARATDGGPVESNLGLRTEGMNKIGPQMMPGNNGRVAAR